MVNSAVTTDLLPCPFCGHPEPIFIEEINCVHCAKGCGARIGGMASDPRPSWNTRAGIDAERKYFIDRYYPLLWALRDRPELPDTLVLHILSHAADFSIDLDEGKRIQRERGLDAVPPVTECEMGAGFWHRVIRAVPAASRIVAPMTVSTNIGSH
jgi:hypothetical protein